MRIVVVGNGRLAGAIRLTYGDAVVAVVSGRDAVSGSIQSLPDCDILWIATADRAIPDVAAALAVLRREWDGATVLHSSGATPAAVLDPFRERGAETIALHPNTSLTGDDPIPSGLVWGITPETPEARLRAEALLAPVAPRLVPLPDERRPLYHAAASTASNFSLTLYAVAVGLFERAGMGREEARAAVEHFMRTSIDRASRTDAGSVLTGPIVRGDTGIVAAHLAALDEGAPEHRELYLALARETVRLLGERGSGEMIDLLFPPDRSGG